MPRYLKHILFWVIILFFQVTRSLPAGYFESLNDTLVVAFEHLCMLPILITASYFTADLIFPAFFYRKKWFQLTISMILSSAFFILLMRLFLFFVFFPKYYPGIIQRNPGFFDFNLFQHAFYIYSTVAIVLMIKYLNYANRLEQQRLNLEKQNYSSELALLRSQINPHFLFNTLNNINALIARDTDKSYKSVLKLSEIMRYMLYEAKNELVPLNSEINYLNSFIGLLSLRIDDPGFIKFNIKGVTDKVHVAPMLLVPYIENAFKHGDKDVTPPGIIINLNVTDETVSYEVINYISRRQKTTDPTSGIGIQNLKRRLELIYPANHDITAVTEADRYIARLTFKYRR